VLGGKGEDGLEVQSMVPSDHDTRFIYCAFFSFILLSQSL
jgi:hypothetical protein